MSGRNREDHSRLPDFYLTPGVRPELRAALEQIWPWFWHYVGQQLGDSDRAADLIEDVATHISRSLEAHPRQVRSLVAFCRVAAINYIGSTKTRESRIDYRGLSRDLEATTSAAAPDWRREVELWIWVDQVLNSKPTEIRIMLYFRILGKTWDQVGSVLGLTGGQARLRFYRTLRQIDEENRGRV
jgi:DNA-directed RNA polymerase specialized sigma24 family protein